MVDSTRFCEVCHINVHIGTGGDVNWNSHVKSKAHSEKSCLQGKNISRILNYFMKKTQPESVGHVPDQITMLTLSNSLPHCSKSTEQDVLNCMNDMFLSPILHYQCQQC